MSKLGNIILGAALAGVGAVSAAAATDYTALREDAYIHERLLIAAKAWYLAEKCPDLAPYKLAALPTMLRMKSHASKLGYSTAEMSAYIDSKEEQARFRVLVEPWAESLGAMPGQPETYCAVGRAEMEERTYVGRLLRER